MKMSCQLMDQLRPKMGDPLDLFWFLSILLILWLNIFFNKSYHGTGVDKFCVKKELGLVIVAWENFVSAYGAATT